MRVINLTIRVFQLFFNLFIPIKNLHSTDPIVGIIKLIQYLNSLFQLFFSKTFFL